MIACLYPRPLLSLDSEGLLFPPGGTISLVAVNTRTAACTSAFVAGCRRAVRVLLAPKLYFIFFCTFDTPLAHLLVVLDLCFRELAVLSEDDIEAKTEYA